MTAPITLLTRKAAAAYLGVDPNTISGGRIPGFPYDAVAVTVGRNPLYDAGPITAFSTAYDASPNRWGRHAAKTPSAEQRAAILDAAPKVEPGTTVVSNVEIASLHPELRKPDGKVDSAAISKWANRGWMPRPLHRFDEAEKVPPLYDLDTYLEHNAAPGRNGTRNERPVDQAVVEQLRATHTIGKAEPAAV
jgi:hypothetical protein